MSARRFAVRGGVMVCSMALWASCGGAEPPKVQARATTTEAPTTTAAPRADWTDPARIEMWELGFIGTGLAGRYDHDVALRASQEVCATLDLGVEASTIIANAGGYTDDRATFIALAVETLCPEYGPA